jgi:hypothetical protein
MIQKPHRSTRNHNEVDTRGTTHASGACVYFGGRAPTCRLARASDTGGRNSASGRKPNSFRQIPSIALIATAPTHPLSRSNIVTARIGSEITDTLFGAPSDSHRKHPLRRRPGRRGVAQILHHGGECGCTAAPAWRGAPPAVGGCRPLMRTHCEDAAPRETASHRLDRLAKLDNSGADAAHRRPHHRPPPGERKPDGIGPADPALADAAATGQC